MRWSELLESEAFPIVSFDKLWHVGTMKAEQKRNNSYEGAGLSISLHPFAWRYIGGGLIRGSIWECIKQGNRFLDYHAMIKPQRDQVANWGLEQGYIESRDYFTIEYFDDELDSTVTQQFDTREKAEEEAEIMVGAEIKEVIDGIGPTQKMIQRCRSSGGLDLLSTLYAEDVLRIDGVWWDDQFQPRAYSAPRGVIVPSMITSWAFRKMGDGDVDTNTNDDDYR